MCALMRNVESRFSYLPRTSMSRSRFDMSHGHKTTFNVGQLIPFEVREVLPGDTFDVDTSMVVRLQTMMTPVMDNLFLDKFWFFIPFRILWSHWVNFMGEAAESPWMDETEYAIPQCEAPENGWNVGTIAEYMGIPPYRDDVSVNALYFRAYAKVVDDWFRSENLQQPIAVPTNDTDVTGVNTGNYVTDLYKGGLPFVVNKYFDLFTSALPAPQRGPDVPIPIGQIGVSGTSSVYGTGYAPMWVSDPTAATTTPYARMYENGSTVKFGGTAGVDAVGSSITEPEYLTADKSIGLISKDQVDKYEYNPRIATGLEAVFDDSQVSISAGTINELRIAFQMQKVFEKLARGGSRYTELLKALFDVDSPDARLQRSEYLGGNRINLSTQQVVQTSATQAQTGLTSTPLATLAAYSQTNNIHQDFRKSFVEHGLLLGVMCVRYDHTYQQGLEKFWSRKDRLEFYVPTLANIGEQPIMNSEIYLQGSSVVNPNSGKPYDDEVFGYNEAWYDYRYAPSRVSGEMRSEYATSLDIWHYADDYDSMPYLSAEWLQEDKGNVDRTLAVKSTVANQLKADIWIKMLATREMPVCSVPGLIDHH